MIPKKCVKNNIKLINNKGLIDIGRIMRGISYLLLGAVFIMLIAVASVNYFSYAFLNQIPSSKIETINDQFKNEVGVLGLFGSTLFLYSESGNTIILDTLIVVLPDGSVYKVYQELNIPLTSFEATAINLASLGIIPPAGLDYDDLTYIFVDMDGTRYFLDDVSPNLGNFLYAFDNVITNVPIEIYGEWEKEDNWNRFWARPGPPARGLYKIMEDTMYVDDVEVEIHRLSRNRWGSGSLWVVIDISDSKNQEFINMLKQKIWEKINNGDYIEKEVDGNEIEYTLYIDLTLSGSFEGDRLFIWSGKYKVEVEIKNGEIVEIEFEDD